MSCRPTHLGGDLHRRPGLCACVVGSVVAVLLLPSLLPLDAYEVDLTAVLQAPGLSHVLGTDENGRDVLARLVVGGRGTLGIALLATLLAVLLGVAIGGICRVSRGSARCAAHARGRSRSGLSEPLRDPPRGGGPPGGTALVDRSDRGDGLDGHGAARPCPRPDPARDRLCGGRPGARGVGPPGALAAPRAESHRPPVGGWVGATAVARSWPRRPSPFWGSASSRPRRPGATSSWARRTTCTRLRGSRLRRGSRSRARSWRCLPSGSEGRRVATDTPSPLRPTNRHTRREGLSWFRGRSQRIATVACQPGDDWDGAALASRGRLSTTPAILPCPMGCAINLRIARRLSCGLITDPMPLPACGFASPDQPWGVGWSILRNCGFGPPAPTPMES